MTLKQQNELILKKIELQMIEDYFSKDSRDNRKQHGQKSSGQMLSILRKYNLERLISVVWDEARTKEFEEAMSKLYTFNIPFTVKVSKSNGLTVADQPYYTWKIKDTDYNW